MSLLNIRFDTMNEKIVLVLKKGASKEDITLLRKQLKKVPRKGVDTKKYCGTIKLKDDPMAIQQKMRNEWK